MERIDKGVQNKCKRSGKEMKRIEKKWKRSGKEVGNKLNCYQNFHHFPETKAQQ